MKKSGKFLSDQGKVIEMKVKMSGDLGYCHSNKTGKNIINLDLTQITVISAGLDSQLLPTNNVILILFNVKENLKTTT